MKYTLPELPYAYDALEPYIDQKTMKIHHTGHHKTYVDKLNEALAPYPDFQKPVDTLMQTIEELPEEIRDAVRKNGGGHANHTLFWTLMAPKSEVKPTGSLFSQIDETFGSLATFKEKFSDVAAKHFASGWAWFGVDKKGKFSLFSSKDHENPLKNGVTPLLVLDVWEHAYYLNYQNKRPAYIEAFWNVVNWKEMQARWDDFVKTGASEREWKKAG